MSSWEERLQILAKAAGLSPRVDRFFFLRHGETEHNRLNILQGWSDAPLNPLGEEQARKAADALCRQPITKIISSPLSRARRTAELVAEITGHPIAFDEDLREKGFGPHEDKPAPQGGAWSIEGEGVETLADFTVRVVRSLNRHLNEGSPLIVAHGGVRRVLLMSLGLNARRDACGNSLFLHALPIELTQDEGWWSVKVVR